MKGYTIAQLDAATPAKFTQQGILVTRTKLSTETKIDAFSCDNTAKVITFVRADPTITDKG